MISRDIAPFCRSLARQYPVLTITGPRQSGKTTLVRHLFKDKAYANLEHIETRDFAREDPIGFLKTMPDGAIIDEIQRVPDLLSYIQVIVDERQINGMFVLTGSSQLNMMASIAQSLAGRTAILRLLPFAIHELSREVDRRNSIDYMYTGFYPRIYDHNLNPTQALGDYFETYVERDIRQLSQIHNLGLFRKFIRMCAGRTGQLLNLSSLGNVVGISHTTAREWISLLETSYIIFLLEPYHGNIRKRLIKSPKLYFYDIGFASYLLGIENRRHIETHPLRGQLFENMVVMEMLKYRYNRGHKNNLTFYRDSNGNEINVLYAVADKVFAVEIKAGETLSKDFFKGLRMADKVFPTALLGKGLIYSGNLGREQQGVQVRNFTQVHELLSDVDTLLPG